MRRVATAAGALAILSLAACGDGALPMNLAPSDATVAAALKDRVNAPDLLEMALRPDLDQHVAPPCRASYRVDSVSVRQAPAHDDLGQRIKVDADFQATRLLAPDAAAASLADCFGADPTFPVADWKQGSAVQLKGAAEITWRGGYWLLRVGDEFIPLPPSA
jgi:hypothetical protein